ncbi:MAG: hypothetical protein CL581_16200 [Alteromonadaceae bacterium]|nr:hypothetical protein [Alteromonadaceae bacterium]
MASTVFDDFIQGGTGNRTVLEAEPQEAPTPVGVGETFKAGMQSGAEGLLADVEYFTALANTLDDDKENAEAAVRRARVRESLAQDPLEGLETFEEFTENPTLSGFITQASKGVGQVLPSAVTSVSGYGVGAVAARFALRGSAKRAATRVVEDSIKRSAAGTASQTERKLAEEVYSSAYKRYQDRVGTAGGFAGGFGAEYVPISGGNLNEALDSGKELSKEQAMRAALVAAPQAAIGAGSELAIYKLIGDVAKDRAVKEGSYFARLAKDAASTTAKSGSIEAGTELVQESIAVVNRSDLDDTFTQEEAQMRLAEAAFVGFFGGAAAGGAGSVAANAIKAAPDVAGGALDTAASVTAKARDLLDKAQGQRVDDDITREQYGDTMTGNTTRESQRDLDAQLRAMVDESSTKQAVWAANERKYDLPDNKVRQITVDGTPAFAAYVPGQGTIVSTSRQVVRDVVASRASDEVLAAALGYSSPKAAAEADTVVQAVDKDGNVISEEVTTQENLNNAYEAAKGLAPDGGDVRLTTVEKALEERKARFDQEQGPVVRDMLDDESMDTLQEMLDSGELAEERTVVRTYRAKADPNQTFENTDQARQEYINEFGPTDFTDPKFGRISEAALREAVQQQRANPNSLVTIEQTGDGFSVIRDDFESLIRMRDQDGEVRVPFSEFLPRAVAKAKKSKFARGSSVEVVAPDGTKSKVNLVDLTRAGQRLVDAREGTGFEGGSPRLAAQRGLQEVLADLQLEGYDVRIAGQSFFEVGNQIPNSMNVPASIQDGKPIGLKALFRTESTIDNDYDTMIVYDVNEDGRRYDDNRVVFRTPVTSEGKVMMVEDYFGRQQGLDVERRSSEFDPDDVEQLGGENEVDQMMGDPRDDIAPDRRAGSAPATGNLESGPEMLGIIDADVRAFVEDLVSTLKLPVKPRFYNIEALSKLSPEALEQAIPDYQSRELVKKAMSDKFRGRMWVQSDGTPMILIRESGNPLQDALVLSHELGHALFKLELGTALENRALYTRLLKAFESDPMHSRYLNAYKDDKELAFEEWYADNVAKWASKRYAKRKARSLTDRHFKALADKIRSLYRAMRRTARNAADRFDFRTIPQDFETYMDSVMESRKRPLKDPDPANKEDGSSFVRKAMVREIEEVIVKRDGEALAAHWRKSINDLKYNKRVKPILKVLMTADGVMRMYAGNEIADMFYVRAQQGGQDGRLGMVPQAARKVDEFQNDFEKEVGKFDAPEVQAALKEAATSRGTSELSPLAQKVRQFLDKNVYDDYIAPSNTDIGKQDNYFPVVLNFLAIADNPDAFVDLLLANNPELNRTIATRAVKNLERYNQSLVDDKPIKIDPTDPASGVEEALLLTKNIDREVMQEAGFLQPPADSFVQYIRHVVKRVEWNKATKDANGKDILQERLGKLKENDQEVAKEIISAYLGYQREPLSPFWRKVNSYGQFLQFVTILPFATIASLPELAGPLINSKEFSDVTTAFKAIGATITNREEATQFARDLGVITHETVANAWVTQAEQDYMDPKVRQMSDTFFRMIGLDFYTKFTREFAAQMGTRFILKHAQNEFSNPRSERYLDELGLTREDVLAWEKSGRRLDTPEGKKVKQGLQRFTESSILRPNAAERPIWASDPHWALIWQLKSYLYSYYKVIVGGVMREARSRSKETGDPLANLTATAAIFALTAVATMPLAMLAMELREYAKNGLAWLLPGVNASDKYFRSDRMDWPEYAGEIIDRSGFLGPLTLGAMSHQNIEWGTGYVIPGAALPFLGPTAETVDTALKNGFNVSKTLKDRIVPIYNQL